MKEGYSFFLLVVLVCIVFGKHFNIFSGQDSHVQSGGITCYS